MPTLLELAGKSFDDPEIRKCIRSSEPIIKMAEENPSPTVYVELIDELKKFYEGLDFNSLVMLWHENYNSIRMMTSAGIFQDNETSFLVRNKMIALGSILNERY